MFIYQIGYGSYEESHYRQYMHITKMTHDELFAIVENALYEVLILKYNDAIKTALDMEQHKWWCNIDNLMNDDAFEERLIAKGFLKVTYTETVNLMGWASAIDSKDWEEAVGSEQKRMVERLKERFDSYAKEHKPTDEYWEAIRLEREEQERALGQYRAEQAAAEKASKSGTGKA